VGDGWFLLTYNLPAEPSSKRVQAWRNLRKLGAVLEAGVWLLPATDETEPSIEDVVQRLRTLGASPLAFRAEDLTPDQTDALRTRYDDVRRREYDELLQRCDRFLGHVQRLIDTSDFKFGSLEEMEEDLEKRRRSLDQIKSRDVFHVDMRETVETSFAACEASLAHYIELVYAAGDSEAPADRPSE
jgi:vacuolar-type H+-ATPase subunit I/STV1